MGSTRDDLETVPFGELRRHPSRVLERLGQDSPPMLITQRGKVTAVLVTPKDFDRLAELQRASDAAEHRHAEVFRFPQATRDDPSVSVWLDRPGPLVAVARRWFEFMLDRGEDVRELMHDGRPIACVEDAAFAYVDAFSNHVNVGFYQGATLPDPAGLLRGSGKRMRHVRLAGPVDEGALQALITAAYEDMVRRVRG